MSASNLPYMKTNPKIIFFTDFDGTITLQDSNDFLVLAFLELVTGLLTN